MAAAVMVSLPMSNTIPIPVATGSGGSGGGGGNNGNRDFSTTTTTSTSMMMSTSGGGRGYGTAVMSPTHTTICHHCGHNNERTMNINTDMTHGSDDKYLEKHTCSPSIATHAHAQQCQQATTMFNGRSPTTMTTHTTKSPHKFEMGHLKWDTVDHSCELPVQISMNKIGTLLETPKRRTALISAIEVSTSGTNLATGGVQKAVRIFNVESFLNNRINDAGESDNASVPDMVTTTCDGNCSASRGPNHHHRHRHHHMRRGSMMAKDKSKSGDGIMCDDEHLSCQFMNPAKVSGLAWGGGSRDSILGCVDYDGIFSRYDVSRCTTLSEGDSHGGRRIWSVRYRNCESTFGDKYITASEDGTCAIWEGNYGEAVMKMAPHQTGFNRPSVCCADFISNDQPLIVMALSDSSIQICDLRYNGCVGGWYAHCGAVSSLRICGHSMVSSSVDSTAALWDLRGCVFRPNLMRRFKCHFNRRNFVGLSIRKDGFVACGSEYGEFVVYHKNWEQPVARESLHVAEESHDLQVPSSTCSSSSAFASSSSEPLVSALCWHPDESTGVLFAGSSSGALHAYQQNFNADLCDMS